MMMIRKPWGFPNLYRDLDQLFHASTGEERPQTMTPAVDVREEEEHFLLQADLPGVAKEEIEVKVEENTLILSGSRELDSEEERDGYHYRERRSGTFSRSFNLGDNVSPEGIEATYRDGVLTVTLPKKPEAKPRQIPVEVN